MYEYYNSSATLWLTVIVFVLVNETFTVVSCPVLHFSFATISDNATVYQTEVNVSCMVGYQLSDNQLWNITRCGADKVWSPQLPNCTGEALSFQLYVLDDLVSRQVCDYYRSLARQAQGLRPSLTLTLLCTTVQQVTKCLHRWGILHAHILYKSTCLVTWDDFSIS